MKIISIVVIYSSYLILTGTVPVTASSFDPLQVMCEINGFMVPAIIDTGAEITVMSAACAKRCRLSSSINTKYTGKAIGVGSSDILGGIDDLSLRIGPISFQNKISILRSSRCDLLIGLDVLRRFDCQISLPDRALTLSVKKNAVRVPLMPSQAGMLSSRLKSSSAKGKSYPNRLITSTLYIKKNSGAESASFKEPMVVSELDERNMKCAEEEDAFGNLYEVGYLHTSQDDGDFSLEGV